MQGPKKKKLKQHAPAAVPQDNGDTPDVDFWAGQTQPYDDDMMDYGPDYGDDMDMPTDTFDVNDQSKLDCVCVCWIEGQMTHVFI